MSSQKVEINAPSHVATCLCASSHLLDGPSQAWMTSEAQRATAHRIARACSAATPHILSSAAAACTHANFLISQGTPVRKVRRCTTHPYSSSAASRLDRFSLARLIRMYPWWTHCQHIVPGECRQGTKADSQTTDLHGERLPEQL
jgi:hypothetical protein